MLAWVRSCLAVAHARQLMFAGPMAELRAARCTDSAAFLYAGGPLQLCKLLNNAIAATGSLASMSLAEKEETPVRSSSQAKAASRIESVMGGLAPTKAACRANAYWLTSRR